MKFWVCIFILLTSCGSTDQDSCDGVDTSQAPDTIIQGPAGVTYYWGDCAIFYQQPIKE